MARRFTILLEARDMITRRLSDIEDAIRRATRRTDDLMDRFTRLGRVISRIGREGMNSVNRLTTGLSGVTGILGGITAAAGVAAVALAGLAVKGIWDHMVQPAMDVEAMKLQINALSGSPEKGSEIYKMSQDFGMQSTYQNEDIMGGTFAFMQNTKDTEQLKEMLKITERLAALNKEEGFRGASFSLKEAMSGDIASIAERFNVGKKDLRDNGFDGKADWQTNLQAVDKTLSGIGIDDNFVKKMGDSTPAQLAKIQKNTKTAFAAIGTGMLDELNPAFRKVNALFADEKGLEQFTTTMSEKFQGLLHEVFGLGNGVEITWKDITKWSSETFEGVKDVLKSSGRAFKSLIEAFTGADLKKPSDTFNSFGDILSGIAKKIDSIRKGFEELDKWGDKMEEMTGVGKKDGVQNSIDDGAWWLPEGAKGGRGLLGYIIEGMPSDRMEPGDKPWWDGSHALGLSNVPKDNYIANLHQGERVLTRQENIAYTKDLMAPDTPTFNVGMNSFLPVSPVSPTISPVAQGGTTSSTSITVNMNGVTIREEADIEAIGRQIVREITLAGART